MFVYLEYWCSEVGFNKIGHYVGYLTNFFGNRYGAISLTQDPYVPNSTVTYSYTIPQLAGLTYNQAVIALNGTGLNYSVVYSLVKDYNYQQYNLQGGYVAYQSPPAGTQQTNSVIITVFQYASLPVTIPNIVGLKISAAIALLTQNGLYGQAVKSFTTTDPLLDQTIATQVAAAGSSTVTQATIGYSYYTYTPVLATPILSNPNSLNGGFSFLITNYDSSLFYNFSTTAGSIGVSGGGVIVDGLSPLSSATVNVYSSKIGSQNSQVASLTGTSLAGL